MVDFSADGKTVLLSSHQIHEVERVADIVAIVRRGRLMCCRALDDLRQHTTQATVVLADDSSPCELPGPVLVARQVGRQCQLTMAADEATTHSLLSDVPRIEQFELRCSSLEEIFVAYMQCPADLALPELPADLLAPATHEESDR
jgi:ABC-2 type transport system ATP-binding protein